MNHFSFDENNDVISSPINVSIPDSFNDLSVTMNCIPPMYNFDNDYARDFSIEADVFSCFDSVKSDAIDEERKFRPGKQTGRVIQRIHPFTSLIANEAAVNSLRQVMKLYRTNP